MVTLASANRDSLLKILQVRKRNGSVVDFDVSKISWAIQRCFKSLNRQDQNLVHKISNYCVHEIHKINKEVITVEEIQDIVQDAIYEAGLQVEFVAYTLFRQNKEELRSKRQLTDEMKEKFLESSQYFETPLQQFQFFDKFSRYSYENKRRETWVETVDRSVDFLRELSQNKLEDSVYQKIKHYILNLKSMPSMRLLASAGEAARRNHISLFNCSYLGIDSIDAFVEVMWISMSGTGVGFSVESKFVSKLPVVENQKLQKPLEFTVEDSTEGWCNALRFCLETWFSGRDVIVDYSLIRPAGSILRVKGGRASGPRPLIDLLNFCRKIITSKQGAKLSPLNCHDIVCEIGNASICGGTRRTALLSLFDPDSEEMRHCKDSDFHVNNPQRWNANNSVAWPVEGVSDDFIRKQMESMFDSERGEPGIFSRQAIKKLIPERREYNDSIGSNPCFKKGTLIHTKNGDFAIETLIGKEVEIWDGNQWLKVDNFRVTAKNQKIIKISLFTHRCQNITQDIFVTPYHSIILKGGEIISALDLINRFDETDDCLFLEASTAPEFKNYEDAYCLQCDRYWNEIYNIREIDKIEDEVYCCTVPTTHSLTLSNGIHIGNCGEISLLTADVEDTKNGGGEFCNLCSIVVRSNDTFETLMEKVEVATIIGTIQSMATDYRNIRPYWKEICDKERLLGVDLNGQLDNPICSDPYVLSSLKQRAIDTNKKYAEILGINQSAAITCVKPSGNSSVLLNCASGLHARWSPYYIRNVRVNIHSALFKILRDVGAPMSPENGQTWDTMTTAVIHFPIKSPECSVFRKDWNVINQLEHWKLNRLYWVEHNPSVSIYYKNNEKETLIKWLCENKEILSGLSFLPYSDAKYDNMPYVEITEEEYHKLNKEFPQIDFSKIYLYEDEDYTEAAQTLACVSGSCEI